MYQNVHVMKYDGHDSFIDKGERNRRWVLSFDPDSTSLSYHRNRARDSSRVQATSDVSSPPY